jgi:two-component system chemotaxis sensor kinase CheA
MQNDQTAATGVVKKKILIVDDDLYLRELYEEILTGAGLEVETSVDGEEGLAKILAKPYDLVLLDIMMPKLDGIGVLTQLSQQTNRPYKPTIILWTNLANDPVIKEALEKGASAFLVKADLTPDQIVAQVKKFLPA